MCDGDAYLYLCHQEIGDPDDEILPMHVKKKNQTLSSIKPVNKPNNECETVPLAGKGHHTGLAFLAGIIYMISNIIPFLNYKSTTPAWNHSSISNIFICTYVPHLYKRFKKFRENCISWKPAQLISFL